MEIQHISESKKPSFFFAKILDTIIPTRQYRVSGYFSLDLLLAEKAPCSEPHRWAPGQAEKKTNLKQPNPKSPKSSSP